MVLNRLMAGAPGFPGAPAFLFPLDMVESAYKGVGICGIWSIA